MLNTKHCYLLKQLIYCYNNANFTIVFLSEKDYFFKMQNPLCASLTFTWVKIFYVKDLKWTVNLPISWHLA